jgi:thymidine phosphorylase
MKTGYISFMETRKIGMALTNLCNGAKTNGLDFSAGIKFHKKIGNYIEKNEIVMEYFCSNKVNFEKCRMELDKTFNVQIKKKSLKELIYK